MIWHLPLLCSSLVVDGQWGLWSQWTPCSKTCGIGVTIRIRYCDNPAPENGGKPCVGNNQETRSCSLKDQCPAGKWQETRVSHIIWFTASIRMSRNACHITDCHVLLVTFCFSCNGLSRSACYEIHCAVKHLYRKPLYLKTGKQFPVYYFVYFKVNATPGRQRMRLSSSFLGSLILPSPGWETLGTRLEVGLDHSGLELALKWSFLSLWGILHPIVSSIFICDSFPRVDSGDVLPMTG